VLMALLTVWYTAFFDVHSTAVVPYAQSLAQFPSFLQQLYMESLGKRVHNDGSLVDTNTGEVVWGTVGSNGQHSYFQLLHQGSSLIPVDFIAVAKSGVPDSEEQYQHLLANCLSQSMALMNGKANTTEPHKHVPGNKPSNIILLSRLDPYNLGGLIALYEHKVYVQSVIWDINAFDQWGVELGKVLSKTMFKALVDETSEGEMDGSSAGLIARIKNWDGSK
jgi:glucose-6-phosphate isomerase